MRRQATISVIVASLVFFGLITAVDVFLRGDAVTQEMLMTNAFSTLIFALAYGAFKAARVIFGGKDQ